MNVHPFKFRIIYLPKSDKYKVQIFKKLWFARIWLYIDSDLMTSFFNNNLRVYPSDSRVEVEDKADYINKIITERALSKRKNRRKLKEMREKKSQSFYIPKR